MTWLFTTAGRELLLTGVQASYPCNVPTIPEIAHALSQINRFTGHTCRPYSVAEHSLLVMDIATTSFDASPQTQFAALMHDAHECITGDVASPIKQVLGKAWADFEGLHERALRSHYGLTEVFERDHHTIKQCDLIALATERRDLLTYDPAKHYPWDVLDAPGRRVYPDEHRELSPWPTVTNWAGAFEIVARHFMEKTLCTAL